jgi:methylenetetrahydrofolate dehydrogenase (NADP+)/methenyltetrahydrofolate cyclohydrolase
VSGLVFRRDGDSGVAEGDCDEMSARLLDGQALAARMQQELMPKVQAFAAKHGRPPGLGILLVGHDPASEVYVRNKVKSGQEHGMRVDLQRLPATAMLADTLAVVEALNRSDVHDGILVQSPLPAAMGHEAEQRVIDAIAPSKDVDGFGAASVGLLVQNRPTLVACTPSGVIELLDRERIPIRGTNAVVIGRSDIVGKPMALLLLHRDATVTICHSRTADLAAECRRADILVAAVGRPGLVRKDWVKPGATVIDVGINRVDDEQVALSLFPEGHPRLDVFRKKGAILVGDVHPAVADVAGALTPVPGGIGPLTIALLMKNTLQAAEARVVASALAGG